VRVGGPHIKHSYSVGKRLAKHNFGLLNSFKKRGAGNEKKDEKKETGLRTVRNY
jgi:hypothetical protein